MCEDTTRYMGDRSVHTKKYALRKMGAKVTKKSALHIPHVGVVFYVIGFI